VCFDTFLSHRFVITRGVHVAPYVPLVRASPWSLWTHTFHWCGRPRGPCGPLLSIGAGVPVVPVDPYGPLVRRVPCFPCVPPPRVPCVRGKRGCRAFPCVPSDSAVMHKTLRRAKQLRTLCGSLRACQIVCGQFAKRPWSVVVLGHPRFHVFWEGVHLCII